MPFTAEHNSRARADFPGLQRTHGNRPLAMFDGPGGTQVPRSVLDAMAEFYATANTNTGGYFATSVQLDEELARARRTLATFLGAESADTISFGANMTSLAFALSHAIGRQLHEGDEVLITALDHEANRGPWRGLRERGVNVDEVRLGADGRLDYGDLRARLSSRSRVLAIGAASNALGTVNDLAQARELCEAVGAWLVVDAVHYAPHFPIDVATMRPDFLLCSAYKFYGPHVGILYSRPGLLDSLTTDRLSTQKAAAPYRIETGTLNHAAIVGARAAVEYLASWGSGEGLRAKIVSAMQSIAGYEHTLAEAYYEQVRELRGVRTWGPDFADRRRAPTVSITLEGIAADDVARQLAERGICAWDGHFYAQRAIEVLGLAECGGLLRVGMSLYNTAEEVGRLVAAIATLCRRG